jgi:hypothetical protein
MWPRPAPWGNRERGIKLCESITRNQGRVTMAQVRSISEISPFHKLALSFRLSGEQTARAWAITWFRQLSQVGQLSFLDKFQKVVERKYVRYLLDGYPDLFLAHAPKIKLSFLKTMRVKFAQRKFFLS